MTRNHDTPLGSPAGSIGGSANGTPFKFDIAAFQEFMEQHPDMSLEDCAIKLHSPSPLVKIKNHHLANRGWENLLKGHVCVGEDHADVNPKKFVIGAIKHFNAIILEHLSQKEHQHLIDRYLTDECAVGEMPRELEEYFDKYESRSSAQDKLRRDYSEGFAAEKKTYNLRAILRAAKEHGVKVICAESDLENYEHDKDNKYRRLISLNKRVVELLSEHLRNHEQDRVLVFVGTAHVNQSSNVPGICDSFENIQDVVVRDAQGENESFVNSATKNKYKNNEELADSEEFYASILIRANVGSDLSYGALSKKMDHEATHGASSASRLDFGVMSLFQRAGDIKFRNPIAARELRDGSAKAASSSLPATNMLVPLAPDLGNHLSQLQSFTGRKALDGVNSRTESRSSIVLDSPAPSASPNNSPTNARNDSPSNNGGNDRNGGRV